MKVHLIDISMYDPVFIRLRFEGKPVNDLIDFAKKIRKNFIQI